MKHASICFALTLALLGSAVHANSSDENKYICLDPTKYDATKTKADPNGKMHTCDVWVDSFQGPDSGLYGIILNSGFDATSQTTAVRNAIKKPFAAPMGNLPLSKITPIFAKIRKIGFRSTHTLVKKQMVELSNAPTS